MSDDKVDIFVFVLIYGGDFWLVEATGIQPAIQIWQDHQRVHAGWEGTEQPEEVRLVAEGPVLRAP